MLRQKMLMAAVLVGASAFTAHCASADSVNGSGGQGLDNFEYGTFDFTSSTFTAFSSGPSKVADPASPGSYLPNLSEYSNAGSDPNVIFNTSNSDVNVADYGNIDFQAGLASFGPTNGPVAAEYLVPVTSGTTEKFSFSGFFQTEQGVNTAPSVEIIQVPPKGGGFAQTLFPITAPTPLPDGTKLPFSGQFTASGGDTIDFVMFGDGAASLKTTALSVSITPTAVPLPGPATAGFALFGGLGVVAIIRKRLALRDLA